MKFRVTPYLFIFLITFSISSKAASLDNINTVFDWVESNFSQYFSPSGQTTQSLDTWQYRFYSETSTYIAVNSQDDVYVLGGQFGTDLVYVANLDVFLNLINESNNASTTGANGNSNGNCVTLPFPNAGLTISHRSTSSEGTLDFTTSYDSTSSTTAQATTTSQVTTSGITSTSTSVTTQNYTIENNYYYVSTVQTAITTGTPVGNFTTNVSNTYTPARNEGPALEYCEQQSWTEEAVTLTSTTSNLANGSSTSTTEVVNGIVESVNDNVTTSAGTYNTVRVRETSASGEVVIAWFSIEHGVLVKTEVYNSDGTLTSSTDTVSISN